MKNIKNISNTSTMIDFIHCELALNHDKAIGDDIIIRGKCEGFGNENHKASWYYSPTDLKGAYSSNIKIKSDNNNSKIKITGNINKFLQGHNIFGTNDLSKLMYATVQRLLEDESLALNPTSEQLQAIKDGKFKVTMIDINQNYLLPNQVDVRNWIKFAGDKMTMDNYGQANIYKTSLYFGKSSQSKEVKFYGKGDEIRVNNSLPYELATEDMLDFTNRILRFEVRLKARLLNELSLDHGSDWTSETVNNQLNYNLSRIHIHDNMPLLNSVVDKLKPHIIATYYRWKDGYNMKNKLSPATFYQHRNELLKYDIDIKTVAPKLQTPTMPLKDVFNNPANIPEWAVNTELLAC